MAEIMEKTDSKREEARKFAEVALKITRSGKEPDKSAIYLAGIIDGYKLQTEIETLESRKRAMA
jgi:hypothetical protein